MQSNPFQTREPNIAQNDLIRTPQREAYAELVSFAANSEGQDREIGIVLPVGCGKSVVLPSPRLHSRPPERLLSLRAYP
jgi:hypothetical protein